MANTGDIPNNITLGASQTVRRNAADNGFEAFTPSSGPHAILSTTHTDTLVDSVVRGDLIVGNATPKWARLALGGSAKSFLTRDANDVVWSTGLLDVATGKTLTVNNSLTLSGADGKSLTLTGSLTVPVDGTVALLGVANVFTENQTISNTAPALALTDTTASAKSLTLAVDANLAQFRESAGVANSLLVLDLASNRVGIGVAPTSIFEVQGASPNPIFRTASTGQSMTMSFYETSTLKGRLLYAGGNPANFRYFGFINDAADYLVFYTLNNTPIYFYPNNALSVTFEAGGNVALVNKITTYNNVTTEGYGVGAIVDDVALTNQGADIASTNFTNAGAVGTYVVHVYIHTTTADAAAGTVVLGIAWNDGVTARTQSWNAVLTSTNGYNTAVYFIKLGSGSVSYNVTHTGSYGTAKYAVYMSCIRLS